MFYKKNFWQIVIGILMLVLCIFFIRNEHLEIAKIKQALQNSRLEHVALGIGLTIVYLLLQALMYVESFACVKKKVTLTSSLVLFLKRNLISVFLPAGSVSALAFFTKEIEKQKIHKSQIYFAS